MPTKKTTTKKVTTKPKTTSKPKSKPSFDLSGGTLWPNISLKEASCPCCGTMASAALLDKVQKFREACGFAIPFTSIYRCYEYNKKIKGSKLSLHLLSASSDGYGAVDCGINKSRSNNRWDMLKAAIQLGMNNFEVCDGHLHIGWAPHGHAMEHRLYWGISK